MRWGYRIWQFFMRLGGIAADEDLQLARGVLHDEAWALFQSMPRGDRWHGVCVLRSIRRLERAVSRDLAQAALLHDVGKASGGLTLAHRTLIVILGRVAPELLERIASATERSWCYPFHVHLHHAQLGATRCALANCSSRTVLLVRHHETRARALDDSEINPHDTELAALQEADDRC